MRYTIVFTGDAGTLSKIDATTARESLAFAEDLKTRGGKINYITSAQEGKFGLEMLRLLAKEEVEELPAAPD